MQRINDTLYELLNTNTNEYQTFVKVTTWLDGSAMTDGKCDGTIYRKKGSEYFKLNWTGPVNVRWFGAKGDGVTNDTPFIQAAIDAFQVGGTINNGIDILIPPGTYLIAGLVVKSGIRLYAEQMAKDNYIANVSTVIKAYGNPDYIIDVDTTASNWIIQNLYIEGDFANQPQLLAGCRLRGQKCLFIGNNVNACAQIGVLNEAGLIYIEKNGIFGWYGAAPTFTGTNDFRGALHIPAMGDSYIYDNEIGAGLSYFTSTVIPRDPVNGRICAMYLGGTFGGTSVIAGNLFENGDRSVVIGNSLYTVWAHNRYELSAMGGLYILGPTQFATFIGERFSDNSLTTDGAADDITIGVGAGGNISFISPIFEKLSNGAIPNSSFQSRWGISNYGSTTVSMTEPVIDSTYLSEGLVNDVDVQALPVRQVIGQFDPNNPQFTSISTQKLPTEIQVGYAKIKQGTDTDNGSFTGALEFWTPEGTLAYSVGFSPTEYLAFTGQLFAFAGDVTVQGAGAKTLTVWSLDGAGDAKIILQGNVDVSNQSTITMNNTTDDLEIVSSGDIVLGGNANIRLQQNGVTLLPFGLNAGSLSVCDIVGRNTSTTEMMSIPASSISPSTGGTGYIQNQLSSAQSANFWISGGGIVGSVMSVNTGAAPAYPLQVGADVNGIGGQFLGRLIIPDAVNTNEAAALGQITASLSSYYTKLDLQTAGSAIVNANNLNYLAGYTQVTNKAAGNTSLSNSYGNSTGIGGFFTNTTGSTDYPVSTGTGMIVQRASSATSASSKGSFQLWTSGVTDSIAVDDISLYFRKTDVNAGTGNSWLSWRKVVDEVNYTDVIPSATASVKGLVDISNQTWLGNKTSTYFTGGSGILCTASTSNYYCPNAAGANSISSIPKYAWAGTNSSYMRVGLGGGSTTQPIAAGYNYAGVIMAIADVTSAATGTHAFMSTMVVLPGTVTAGGASITKGAALYIEGAPTYASSNYALYISAGNTDLGSGNVTANTFLANDTSTGTLSVSQAARFPLSTVTSNTTLSTGNYTVICDTTVGAVTVTLPTAASSAGRIYIIKRTGANNVIIDPDGSELIDGVATKTLSTDMSAVTIQSDSVGWFIISSYTSLI